METIGAKRLRRHWPQILDELRPEGVVITRHGRPVAVLRRTNGDLIGIIEEDIAWTLPTTCSRPAPGCPTSRAT